MPQKTDSKKKRAAREALHRALYPPQAELVIGLVAQVGTNQDDLIPYLKTRLRSKDYDVEKITLSAFLTIGKGLDERDRIYESQDAGNRLRKAAKCNHILALCAVAQIASKLRIASDGPPLKRAFIVRSLKRPEEIEVLRSIYGSAFLCIGVHSPKAERQRHLEEDKGMKDLRAKSGPGTAAQELVERDETESDYYGQRTRDAFELCDVYIGGIRPVYEGLDRLLNLLFGSVFTTPNRDELGMYLAQSAACRSQDLSRQVGAAILNQYGEVLAIAPNEVPRRGGGQYEELRARRRSQI